MRFSRQHLWLLALVPIALGLARLQFDVEILNLLPARAPAVEGLKIYQRVFANAGELVITVRGPSAERAEESVRRVSERLSQATDLVSQVVWQPPWLAHPDQAAELVAYLWLNQPPLEFQQLTNRLASTNLPALLSAAREELATSMSPGEVAKLSYDPYGLTRLPEKASQAAPAFGEGQDMFAGADGKFRLIFLQARGELRTYRQCARWLRAVEQMVNEVIPPAQRVSEQLSIHYTGRPVFVSEIAGGMERDMTGSVLGTALIIAILFYLAHRRWRPMLWLLTLLAVILVSTLALGGLFFGTINVISMGFAAILLGLAVDYAVVHYQEALAQPLLSVPEVRAAIAPSIFWAATTTIAAFLVLNFGGLPGLAQLGTLVAMGVGLSAVVMIFAYLPPLFPERRKRSSGSAVSRQLAFPISRLGQGQNRIVLGATGCLLLIALGTLISGLPRMDATADALRPRRSSAYAALEELKEQLGQKQEPLWLIISGADTSQVAQRLDAVEAVLDRATSNGVVSGATLPASLWPRSENQRSNRSAAHTMVQRRTELSLAAKDAGFTDQAFAFTDGVLKVWENATSSSGLFWPTNQMSRWIFERFVARTENNLFALGLVYPALSDAATGSDDLAQLSSQLNVEGVWLTGWPLLGAAVFRVVRANLWKLLVPVVALVLVSLWLAFRRSHEVALSLGALGLSALGLLTVMRWMGWSWNLLNLMALPLILGTGVDYGIFMQLALRRHQGDLRAAHASVGRALLLCGGTAVAGFGSLAFSSNAGMSSLGQICAVGIAFNVAISVLLLPVWWKRATASSARGEPAPN